MLLAYFYLAWSRSFWWPTLERPWMKKGDPIEKAEEKLDEAFDFFSKITTPYFCFHDRDISPEGINYAETQKNFFHIIDLIEKKISETGVQAYYGVLLMHFLINVIWAVHQLIQILKYLLMLQHKLKDCMEATMRLGGQNYVLWGGREGYETILKY